MVDRPVVPGPAVLRAGLMDAVLDDGRKSLGHCLEENLAGIDGRLSRRTHEHGGGKRREPKQ